MILSQLWDHHPMKSFTARDVGGNSLSVYIGSFTKKERKLGDSYTIRFHADTSEIRWHEQPDTSRSVMIGSLKYPTIGGLRYLVESRG